MREYAVKKRLDAAQPAARGKAVPGMSNQAMLAFLSAMPKKRVPEEEGIRQRLSDKFGVDFSGLKITRDAALGDIQERAYTRGNEIHLAPDVDTGSAEGQQILMHEAAHVIQQGTRSLSGGMLHDSALEAQANDIASGAGHIDVSNFSMPAAEGAPVQGFLDFFFNRKKYKANKLLQRENKKDPKLAREMGEILENLSLSGGTAIFDPEVHAQRFKAAANSPDGRLYKPHLSRGGVTADILERELIGLPGETHDRKKKTMKLYGVSQEELDAMSSLDPAAYRTLIERAYRGAYFAANGDWTNATDSELLEGYTTLKAISRLAVVANQASDKVGIDKDLSRNDLEVEEMIQGFSQVLGSLMMYANKRLRGMAGLENSEEYPEEVRMMAEYAQMFQQQFKQDYIARMQSRRAPSPAAPVSAPAAPVSAPAAPAAASAAAPSTSAAPAIAPAAPRKRGFLARLFGKG